MLLGWARYHRNDDLPKAKLSLFSKAFKLWIANTLLFLLRNREIHELNPAWIRLDLNFAPRTKNDMARGRWYYRYPSLLKKGVNDIGKNKLSSIVTDPCLDNHMHGLQLT